MILKKGWLNHDAMVAGEYRFVISYKVNGEFVYDSTTHSGEAPATSTVYLTVQKHAGAITNIQDISKIYDASPVSAPTFDSLSTSTAQATFAYKVKGADDTTYTATAPSTYGDYIVKVTVPADLNYEAASATAEFQISKLPMPAITEAIVFDAVTEDSITVKKPSAPADATFLYSKDGTTWQESNVFSGLEAGTEYTFSVRVKASDADHRDGPISTGKQATAAKTPANASECRTPNYTAETFDLKPGYQYRVYDDSRGTYPAASGWSAWQPDPVSDTAQTIPFVPGTKYEFRKGPETKTNADGTTTAIPASQPVADTFAARGEAPAEPVVKAKTDTTIEIEPVNGVEYSMDGVHWTTTPTFTGLAPNHDYTVHARYAATSSKVHSEEVTKRVTTKNVAPAKIADSDWGFSDITKDSITVEVKDGITGLEYSKDGGVTWQDSNKFTGLTPATEYSFTVRKKETADTMAGKPADVKKQYTAADTPKVGDGVTTDTRKEQITVEPGYQYRTYDNTKGTYPAASGWSAWQPDPVSDKPITFEIEPGTKYEVRKGAVTKTNADGSTSTIPASKPVGDTFAARGEAPEAPVMKSKTDTTVEMEPVDGVEYSIDGVHWTTTPTFTGLDPDKEYTVQARYAATDKAVASKTAETKVTTKKSAPAKIADSDWGFSDVTKDSITVEVKDGITGLEYSKDGGVTWQDSNQFTGLTPATEYSFTVRKKETADTMAGEPADVKKQYTAADTPKISDAVTTDTRKEQITVEPGYQYRTYDNTKGTYPAESGWSAWQPDPVSDKPITFEMEPGTKYEVRKGAVTKTNADGSSSTIPASKPVGDTFVARGEAPAEPVVKSKTDTTVEMEPVDGVEYSMDGVHWTTTPTFTGLNPNAEYTVQARYAATDSTVASKTSETKLTTKKSAPAAINDADWRFEKITANKISVTALEGVEYSKDGGITWQDSNEFTGLKEATEYSFAVRVKATDDTMAGIISNVKKQSTLNPGVVNVNVKRDEKVVKTDLATPKQDMINAVLDEKEKARVADGEDAEIWLQTTDISSSIPAESKNKLLGATTDYVIGSYIDISLFKKFTADEKATQITNTAIAIKVSMVVPESLRVTDEYTTRTYAIARNHEGKVDILPCTFDATTFVLTFESDRFSDYALIYKDVYQEPEMDQTTGEYDSPTIYMSKQMGLKQKFKLFQMNVKGAEINAYSSNPKVVKVSKKGVLTTGKKTGKAKVVFNIKKGKQIVQYVTKVTVKKSVKRNYSLVKFKSKYKDPSIALYKRMNVGKTWKISLTHMKDGTVTYTSSNKKIAKVDSKGKVKALKRGKATLEITVNKYGITTKYFVSLRVTKNDKEKPKDSSLKVLK